jgi:pimeloyl-ACP methyl ester carboxylesterase
MKKNYSSGSAFLLPMLLVSLLFADCSRKITEVTTVKTGVWYFAEGYPVALRFDSNGEVLSGQFLYTGRAVAAPASFTAKRGIRGLKFSFSTHPDINFSGVLTEDGNDYLLTPRHGKTIRLRYYDPGTPPAWPGRYGQQVFNKYVRVEKVYGYASGYYASKPAKSMSPEAYAGIVLDVLGDVTKNVFTDSIRLDMDLYSASGDPEENRPLLLLIHGGAFILGDKRDDLIQDMAIHYAKCGYLVASVNYRIGYPFVPGMYSQLERCMYRGIQDVRAALRFLSDHHQEYGFDPERVFVAGNSAGGFLSLFTAYMEDAEKWQSSSGGLFGLKQELGCLDCSTNRNKGNFKIIGVVNLWGAVTDLTIIDAKDRFPALLVHGTSDRIVPYGYDYPFTNVDRRLSAFFTGKVYGSKPVYDRMKEVGIDAKLITINKGMHEPQDDDTAVYPMIIREMSAMMHKAISGSSLRMSGPAKLTDTLTIARYFVFNHLDQPIQWQVEGGIITRKLQNWAEVVWIMGSASKAITAYTTAPDGVVRRIRMVVE